MRVTDVIRHITIPGSLAQLNRASDYGSEGYRFESCASHKRAPRCISPALFCVISPHQPGEYSRRAAERNQIIESQRLSSKRGRAVRADGGRAATLYIATCKRGLWPCAACGEKRPCGVAPRRGAGFCSNNRHLSEAPPFIVHMTPGLGRALPRAGVSSHLASPTLRLRFAPLCHSARGHPLIKNLMLLLSLCPFVSILCWCGRFSKRPPQPEGVLAQSRREKVKHCKPSSRDAPWCVLFLKRVSFPEKS